jgi:hypothetical protein
MATWAKEMDFLRLSDGPELRALFYDVVFRLLGEACPGQKRKGQHRAKIILVLVMLAHQAAERQVAAIARCPFDPETAGGLAAAATGIVTGVLTDVVSRALGG